MNFFMRYKGRSTIQKMALTGVFFGLVILFQYLERFMPFAGTFIKLNFSLLFILPIFYFAGPSYGILVMILRFVIGLSMKGEWGSMIGIVSHLILFISTLIAIIFMYIYSFAFNGIKNHNKKNIYISIATVLSSSITLTILNGIWFTPMYLSSYDNNLKNMFNIKNAIDVYKINEFYKFHFGIHNYWLGIIAVYFSGNLLKFSLIYFINYPLSKVIRHYY